jgi:hypothetical protein
MSHFLTCINHPEEPSVAWFANAKGLCRECADAYEFTPAECADTYLGAPSVDLGARELTTAEAEALKASLWDDSGHAAPIPEWELARMRREENQAAAAAALLNESAPVSVPEWVRVCGRAVGWIAAVFVAAGFALLCVWAGWAEVRPRQ